MRRARYALLTPLVLLLACDPSRETAPAAVLDPAAYAAEVDAWHRERVERLTGPEGWLSLTGLFWLEEGDNALGAAVDNRVLLPAGRAPESAGVLTLSDERVTLRAAPGSGLTHAGEPVTRLALANDTEGEPTRIELGDLLFYVIRRGERIGVRVKDRAHAAHTPFAGIERYPVDPAWRIVADFVPYEPPRQIPIPNVLGDVSDSPSSGALEFRAGGASHRLDVLAEPGDPQLFVIFADATTGGDTYGGGRYLYADAADADGRIVLDFNRAYNPPCVFTPYATCPLPPRQNRLAVAVTAGEKTFGGEGH